MRRPNANEFRAAGTQGFYSLCNAESNSGSSCFEVDFILRMSYSIYNALLNFTKATKSNINAYQYHNSTRLD